MSANPSAGVMAARGAVGQCWSCQGPLPSEAFCATCGVIQPPGPVEFFAQLELEPTFDVDLEELERNYFGLQRKFHPDRFATKSARERECSLQHATNLNDAFNTLRSLVPRAEYVLQMRGAVPLGGPEKTITDETVLMEAMETREALADAQTVAEVKAITDRAQADIGSCTQDLSAAFHRGDLTAAAALIVRLTYLQKLEGEAAQRARRLSRSE